MYLNQKRGGRMAKTNASYIRDDLEAQLRSQGKNGKYYDDLVNDYIYYLGLRTKLKEDIRIKGLRYKTTNAAGKEVEKANESIVNLTKVTTLMLKILSELKLTEPIINPPSKNNSSSSIDNKNKVEDDSDDLL